jgi:hypothetical protein
MSSLSDVSIGRGPSAFQPCKNMRRRQRTLAQGEVGYNEGHKGPRQARLVVSKPMLGLLPVCCVVQFLQILAYPIFGLAPVPRARGQAPNDVKPGAGEAPFSELSSNSDQ